MFTVKVYDPKAPGHQRWIGTFATEEEARERRERREHRHRSVGPGAHSRRVLHRMAAGLRTLRTGDAPHVRLRREADRG